MIPKTKRRKCKDCKKSFERYFHARGNPHYCKQCYNNRRVFGMIKEVKKLVKRNFSLVCVDCDILYDSILRDGNSVNKLLDWLVKHEHHKIIPIEMETPSSEELDEMVYDPKKDYIADFIKSAKADNIYLMNN